jgi:hypothetical protein
MGGLGPFFFLQKSTLLLPDVHIEEPFRELSSLCVESSYTTEDWWLFFAKRARNISTKDRRSFVTTILKWKVTKAFPSLNNCHHEFWAVLRYLVE